MTKKILLNNSYFNLDTLQLPCLIHGKEKAGSSLFTMSLISQFYQLNYKLLCITGFTTAKDEFLNQTQATNNILVFDESTYKQSDITKKAIFMTKEKYQYFIELVWHLPDIKERIILLKNIDLLDKEVFETVRNRKNVIISGDFDKCYYSDELLKIDFQSKILFSLPKKDLGITIPILQEYHGYLKGKDIEGELKLEL